MQPEAQDILQVPEIPSDFIDYSGCLVSTLVCSVQIQKQVEVLAQRLKKCCLRRVEILNVFSYYNQGLETLVVVVECQGGTEQCSLAAENILNGEVALKKFCIGKSVWQN
jgi:hypothetical protein